MWTKDDEYDGENLFGYGPDPEKEQREPEKILIGKVTVLQWMQLCIDANAIKVEGTENLKSLNLGSDHTPAWIATSYLYESYRATCRQGRWYPVNDQFFGVVLTRILGPALRLGGTAVPENLAQIMFGDKRSRRPWGTSFQAAKHGRDCSRRGCASLQ
jgi:hypothetical protein